MNTKIKNLTTKQLLEVYNTLSIKPIKRFSTRTAAETRVGNLLVASTENEITKINRKLLGELGLRNKKPKTEVLEKLTPKQKIMLFHVWKSDNKGEVLNMRTFCKQVDSSWPIIKDTFTKLENADFITRVEDPKVCDFRFSDSMPGKRAKAWMSEHYTVIEKLQAGCDWNLKDYAKVGKKSEYAGCKIFKQVKNNPRREGTHGFHSWECYVDGMTYEEYLRCPASGHNHLMWDLKKGFIKLVNES